MADLYFIILFILVLLIIVRLFLVKIKKLKKINAGLSHVLDKSEDARTKAEGLISKILLVIDDLPEGILVVDEDNKISNINGRAEKILGINRRQILNKSVFDLLDFAGARKIASVLLVNLKSYRREEIEIRKNFILEMTIEQLTLGKNKKAKLVILNDITKLKNIESAKDQFVSLAAHQLKSPLSAIKLSLRMLLDNDFGKISEDQQNILEKTYKKNESLIYLVENLLEEARNDESGGLNKKSLISLEDLVLPVADFYDDEIKKKKIIFKFDKPEEKTPVVSVDAEKIKMAMQNLFDNAVKYTPVKGKIEVAVEARKNEVEFQIKDSGMGIPENQKDKIFKRFSRADNVIKAKTAGSGLGLAIAKDIIEKNKGKIWFQSKENEGSTFFFSLPVS